LSGLKRKKKVGEMLELKGDVKLKLDSRKPPCVGGYG